MGLSYQMTYKKESRRWRKRYRGRDYYFRAREGESKAESYKRCYALWLEKKAEIDVEAAEARDRPHQQMWRYLLEEALCARAHAKEREDVDGWQRANILVEEYTARIEGNYNCPLFPSRTGPDLPNLSGNVLPDPKPQEPPRPWETAEAVVSDPIEDSIGDHVDRFVEMKRQQTETGKLSLSRFGSIERYLRDFATYAGTAKPADSIDGKTLLSYHGNLRKRIAAGSLSEYSGRDYFAVVKQFTRHLYEINVLSELPRNLETRSFRFDTTARAVDTFSIDEVRQLLDTATDRTRLFVLLMLNTGAGPTDISDLAPGEVDWKKGRIKRKRSKTANHESVPVVDYPLWPETFRLLLPFRSKDKERVLLTRSGKPLVYKRITDNGKIGGANSVQDAWSVLAKKASIDKPSKLLRKTSASLIAAEYGETLAELFLGHCPKTTASKFYLRPDTEKFDAAVKWLGSQFGIE